MQFRQEKNVLQAARYRSNLKDQFWYEVDKPKISS